MKIQTKHLNRAVLAIAVGLSTASSAFADTSLLTFDTPPGSPGFTVGTPYASWAGAGFTFGPTSYDVSVAAGGYGGQYVPFSSIVNGSGNTTIQLTINLTTTGSSAAIVTLGDADGTEYQYAWYGLASGPHVLTKLISAYNSIVNVGTTPGLDLTNLAYVHIQGNVDPYTIQWQDLRLTGSYSMKAVGQTVLLDFGDNSSWRGVSVANPDVNGNYWNEIHPGAYFPNLIDTGNNITTVAFGFDGVGGAVSPDSYNGPAGATTDPLTPTEIAATDIDAVAMGMLGITNAAIDYVTGVGVKFQIQQLDPTKKYNLTFYGSHKYNSDSNTIYSVYSESTYTALIGQTNLSVYQPGSDWLHNRNQTVTISNLTPPADGIFYVNFVGSLGGAGYLNSLQVSVVAHPNVASQSYNPATHGFTLTWASVPGKIYSILSSTNLSSGFTTLLTGVNSGGTSTTKTVTLPDAPDCFLRVQQE